MRQPRFRIMRRVGDRNVDVPHPLIPGTDGCYLHAVDAETALANAKRLLPNTRNLFAIPEAN